MELPSSQPGYWDFFQSGSGTYLYFNCPCGCKYPSAVRLHRQGEPAPAGVFWEWDGSLQAPTLSPSLRRHTPCGFHGYLHGGRWSSAGDGAPLASNVANLDTPRLPRVDDDDWPQAESPPIQLPPQAPPAPRPHIQIGDRPMSAPAGYAKTHHLKFIDGILHQLHRPGNDGEEPAEHWEPVASEKTEAKAPEAPAGDPPAAT